MPLSEIAAGELVAVLTTLMLPDPAPAAVGANLTLSARLCPGARLADPENPETLNPAPVAATCEMLTLPVPVFFSVIAFEEELLTRVVSKLKLLALVESKCVWLCTAAIPVPETLTVEVFASLWLEVTVRLPLNVAAFGWNTTLNEVLRGARDRGNAGLLTTNCGRLLATCSVVM